MSKSTTTIKVGYVPEHFSTPLFFARDQGYYAKQSVEVVFPPFPSGTGHMIQALKAKEIDVAIGLTEAFVSGIGKGADHYKIVGTYVQSPLNWAISTGAKRDEIKSVDDIKGKTIGISRLGSGSNVMPFVLAKQQGWTDQFEFEIQDNFKNLRDGVNHTGSVKPTDAFMWEVFTTKKYYDSGEIKQIGNIYTPWPSWVITASSTFLTSSEGAAALKGFFNAVNEGIAYFNSHHDEAVTHISTNLDYSAEDARAWLKTVQFVDNVAVVDKGTIVDKTVEILQSADVLDDSSANYAYLHTTL
uniref:ARAD1D31878p n=1 Tax=Blastobotrys adeninivorans TaxID=409370 RepID=A0A060TBH9_BLAAD